LAAALVVAAALFVIGTRGESHATKRNALATTTSTTASTTTVPASVATPVSPTEPVSASTTRAPEGSPAREAQEHGATTVPTTSQPSTSYPAASAAATSAPAPSTTAASEGTPQREAAEGATGHVETASEQSSEKVLGVNPESGSIVASVVIASIVLAALTVYRRLRAVLWVAAAFCAFAAAADLHEVRMQIDRSKTGLAVVAATVAVVHVIGAFAGVVAAREPV